MVRQVCFKIFSAVLFFIFLASISCAGEIRYAKVLEVEGRADFFNPLTRGWVPLSEKVFLRKGSLVRTYPQSSVEIALDWPLENMLKLGENSELRISDEPPYSVFLRRGGLFVFREWENHAATPQDPLDILTKDASIRVGLGGYGIDSTEKGTLLKVFGENAQVKGKSKPVRVEEGFKFYASAALSQSALQRMRFRDYGEWLLWMKKLYGKKDDFTADRAEKELVS